jgi:N-acetylneuraminate lyase
MSKFQGILPAVVTPFDGERRFAPAAFEQLLNHLYGAGVDGIYVCGQTGEGLAQSADQRKRVTDCAIRWSPPGKTVIVHVGAHRIEEACELAGHAATAGAHAVSSLPPLGYSFEDIRRYYKTLAEATDIPFFLYYFPEICPAISTADQLLDLCSLPHVAGVKFTDFDLFKLSLLRREGLTVFNGRDEVLVAGLLMGANGGIGTFYNLVPEWFVEVARLARENRWEEARVVQNKINSLIRHTLSFPLFPAVKQILAWRLVDCGPCLAPRRGLSLEESQRLREGLLRLELPASSSIPV